MSQVSGDICLDFRENSKDEILKIKEFFNEKKSLSQHSNQAWLRNGELKDDVFVCGQYLSFSSVDVKKGTIENVSEFLKELIHVVPDISFKGKVFEEYETMDRKLRIKKRREEWKTKGKQYHDNLVKEEKHLIEAKREARNSGNFYMAPEAKVGFAIRIKGVNHIRPQVKKILRLLRLRQLNNGVFVKINKATLNMIKRVEPYVVFGYPNRKTISDLIYKRGFAKINHSRIPLTDNMIIEQSLGKYGINCVEDLIEEIYRCGPHFKEANSFLWTFKMNNPKGGWSNKNHSFQNGGDWGNREEEINKLIRKMN